jgi:AraC-like DNA-binding protein
MSLKNENNKILKNMLSSDIKSQTTEKTISYKELVSITILNNLGSERITLKLISYLLDISPRTLQRLLLLENTKFSEILTNVQLTKAAELLKNTDYKLVEISNFLGFEAQPNFTRAFQRWSGVTPSKYRAQFNTNKILN